MLLVVIGEGKLVVPVDVAARRPNPARPGRTCRDKLTRLQVLLDRTCAALQRRCRWLPPPLVSAESWFGDSGWMAHVASCHGGTVVVEGKTSYVFHLPDGLLLKGSDLLTRHKWRWRVSPQLPGGRYARFTARYRVSVPRHTSGCGILGGADFTEISISASTCQCIDLAREDV